MALSSSALLRPQTALQLLLEEINFQRAKEMRQMLKDDGGFVVLQGTTYWTDLFVRHFLFQAEPEQNIDSDDLLFFVRKKHVKGSSRHMPKFETDVDVYRKDSRKLPIGDPDVDWEETVYLNLIIHQFNYTLTLAICTRTSPKELQVLRRHSQRVYASPSRRKMDTKGDGEEMTYPHICFMVDNFDEVFGDIMVRDGEMVCVELVANDRDGTVQGVIFLGSIRYDALKKVYDARQSSISTKLAQRMTFGLFSSGAPQTRCEFVRMKGPQGKGHAEMAVTKPKGSGVETPTSEPGFCVTDMYDEWDEDPDDFLNYRHQRRLSDPSANLNNYSRYGWKTKAPNPDEHSSKARSENEGLDSLASEVSEIEAGDLKDDRRSASPVKKEQNSKKNTSAKLKPLTTSASQYSTSNNATATCCNCFGPLRNQWNDAASGQMSEVYCRACDEEEDENVIHIPRDRLDSPAILANVTRNRRTRRTSERVPHSILTIESELEMPHAVSTTTQPIPQSSPTMCREKIVLAGDNSNCDSKSTPKKIINNNRQENEDYELGDDATECDDQAPNEHFEIKTVDETQLIRVHGKEELPVSPEEQQMKTPKIDKLCHNTETTSSLDNSQLHPANSSNGDRKKSTFNESQCPRKSSTIKKASSDDNDSLNKSKLRNDGSDVSSGATTKHIPRKVICTNDHPLLVSDSSSDIENDKLLNDILKSRNFDDCNGNNSTTSARKARVAMLSRAHQRYSTLPKVKKPSILTQQTMSGNRSTPKIPTRITPDGTTIFYWCDLTKQTIKELDDGAYNPLWATKGFTQTFHFWKEHRRQQSVPLNAFLTYVTLPWWSIAKDLLDHRETPILTF